MNKLEEIRGHLGKGSHFSLATFTLFEREKKRCQHVAVGFHTIFTRFPYIALVKSIKLLLNSREGTLPGFLSSLGTLAFSAFYFGICLVTNF